MNRRALVIATVAIAAALFAAAAVYYPRSTDGIPPDKSTLIRAHSPVIGPSGAPVTIASFSILPARHAASSIRW